MCFDISLLFGNKPLFVQLSTNKFGRLLTAHQHTAKDRPHAETTTHPIGSHTRNEQSRIDFLRIFYGCRLTARHSANVRRSRPQSEYSA